MTIPFDLPVPEPEPASKCRRCHRRITDPVSLGYQIGPDCRHQLGIAPPKKPPRFSVRWTGPVRDQIDLLNPTNIDERGEMAEIHYHDAHAPYTEAVADALEAAGIAVEDWFADPNDPRDSCITLAGSKPGLQRVVGWTEEKGWMYGTGPENEGLTAIYGICDGVLPEPAEVVEDVRKILDGNFSATDSYTVRLRSFEDDEDGFEERLAAYHPKAEAASGEGESK